MLTIICTVSLLAWDLRPEMRPTLVATILLFLLARAGAESGDCLTSCCLYCDGDTFCSFCNNIFRGKEECPCVTEEEKGAFKGKLKLIMLVVCCTNQNYSVKETSRLARYSIKMQQQKSTESLEKDAKLYGKIFGEKSSNKIYFTTSGSSSPSQNTQLPSNEQNDVGEDIHEDAAGHVSGHVVLVVALCRPACCARADCTKATCPLCYRRMLAAPELCPCLDTGGAKLGINRTTDTLLQAKFLEGDMCSGGRHCCF